MNFWKYLHPLLKTDNDSRYSTANYAVLKSLADSLSDAERDTLSKKIQLIFETATGEYLDEYGKWFGVSRYPNEDDNDYRERIKHYLLIPRSTVQGIIEGIQYYLNDTKAQISIYEPWKNIFYLNKSNLNGDDHLPGYYYRYAIIDVHIDRPMSQAIHDAIEAFKPAGVKFYVTVDGNLGEDVKRLILADFKVTRLDTINRVFGFNYARILPFTFSDRLATLVPNTNYFKTNNSNLNGADVLAGSPTHNVTYWNHLRLSYSPYKDVPVNLLINTSSSATNGRTTIPGAIGSVGGINRYSRTDSYEQVTAPSSGEFYYRFVSPDQSNLYGLTPGATYTLSGSASHTSGELKFRAQYGVNGTEWSGDDMSDLVIPVSDGSVFTPFSYTFTIPAGATGVYFSLQNYDFTNDSLFRFNNMKLEKGTTASPWSPNPADPEYGSTPEQRAVLSTNNSTYLTLPATKYKDVPVNLLTGTSMNKQGIVVAGKNDIDNYDKQNIDVNPSNQYVYSTNIVSSATYPLLVRNYILWFDKDGKYISISIGENETINSPNSRISNVFNPPQNASSAYLAPVSLAQTRDSDTSIVWNHEKFEIGTTASPWSPNPADPEYYENMVDGTLSLYNQLVNNYSSIVNLYSGSTNYEKVVSMLKDSNIAIQEKVISDKSVLINGVAPNKDGIIDIDKSKISYTGSDITVPLVVTSNDTCRISYAAAGIYIRLASPGMGSNLKSDQLETNIKKA